MKPALRWAVPLLAVVLAIATTAWTQSVGSAASFAVLGGSAVTAAGVGTIITGDVGVSPGTSITGFPAGATVVPPFGIHNNDAAAIAAQGAVGALYTSLVAAGPATPIPNQLNGQSVGPGIYSLGAADLAAGGILTLNGSGTYIFQMASSLTANVGSNVVLAGGANACNVFWQVTSAATLNGVTFPGNVVAQAGITLGVGASLNGRALVTPAGPVTMAGGNAVGGCSTAPPSPTPTPGPTPTPVPALPDVAGLTLLALLLGSGAYILSRR